MPAATAVAPLRNATMPPKNVDLTKRALLVGISISRWEPWITDEDVSKDVNTEYNTHRNAGHYRKRLLRPEALLRVTSATNAIRKMFDTLTLPWSDEGWRICSGAGYTVLDQRMAPLFDEFNAAADEFEHDYAAHIRDAEQWMSVTDPKSGAQKAKRAIFNLKDYPAKALIRGKFSVGITIQNLPSGSDFRVDLGKDAVAKVSKAIEQQRDQAVDKAMKDIFARFQDVIGHMVTRLRAYNEEDGSKSTFRDSLVTNISDLLDLIPILNITGDPKVDQFASNVRKQLTSHTPDTLRDDAKTRDTVAKRAEDILSKMSQFLA